MRYVRRWPIRAELLPLGFNVHMAGALQISAASAQLRTSVAEPLQSGGDRRLRNGYRMFAAQSPMRLRPAQAGRDVQLRRYGLFRQHDRVDDMDDTVVRDDVDGRDVGAVHLDPTHCGHVQIRALHRFHRSGLHIL